MSRCLLVLAICLGGLPAFAQTLTKPVAGKGGEVAVVKQRLSSYISAFNKNDAQAVAAYWSIEAVSVDEETGERTTGRKALLEGFKEFFAKTAGARLTGEVGHVRLVRPEVAIAEGEVTLFTPNADPVASAYTAVLVKEDGKWFIESSRERDLPSPPTPADALAELAWLAGEWRDQTEGVEVVTSVRWSPNKAFLIRSYRASYEGGDLFEGTQIIGWDPRGKGFRTWNFNSDGSFGEGAVSRLGDRWQVRITQVEADGTLATATQVITRVDNNTMTVKTIGRTTGGAPLPSLPAITVTRVAEAEPVDASAGESE